MSFPLTRSSSPPPFHDPHGLRPGADADLLASALQNALQGISSHPQQPAPAASSSRLPQDDMHNKDDRFPNLEIVVTHDVLSLNGVGVDVAPTLLSGHVVLNLAESTSIKNITLDFRGKARLPPPANEPISLNTSALTYLVCNHEWSFLEGERKRSHTLKAGRHLFPFQLRIGGSLPSSIDTSVFGGASVAYKLRAVAARPGFAHNLTAQMPISITRSFAPEALEYQQTLEIENTWPEKIMYSIMIPHKAWAAGDNLSAVVKFSPLNKGVRVLSVGTTINETVKLYAKSGWQETSKPVVTAKHEIHGAHAVPVDPRVRPPSHRSTPSGSATPALASGYVSPPLHIPHTPASYVAGTDTPIGESTSPEAGPSSAAPASGEGSSTGGVVQATHEEFELSEEDVVTQLDVHIPVSATPTHALEPIVVSHRVRWSILISNPDGHTSELRCSLPLHLLDARLIDEARAATAQTRRLLLGGPDVPEERDEDLELPSYSSHVRDRVANMYLPTQSVLRVTNPWVQQGVSPVQGGRTGTHTPLEAHHLPSALAAPPVTAAGLDYVNSELLLSLSADAPPALESPPDTMPPTRAPSPSPELGLSRRSSGSGSSTPADTSSIYLHDHSAAARGLHGLFNISMKPFTSLTSPFHHTSRHPHATPPPPRTPAAAAAPTPPPIRSPPHTAHSLLHRAFTEVPDYGIAARGFLGGVPPLESMQGLPSYEESARGEMMRSQSTPDLPAVRARAVAERERARVRMPVEEPPRAVRTLSS